MKTETVLYGALGGKVPKAKPMKVSDAKAALAKTEKFLADPKAFEDRTDDRANALKSFAKVKKDFDKIVALAAKVPRADSDRILEYLASYSEFPATADEGG